MSAETSPRAPAPKELRDLLGALLGREVTLRPAASPARWPLPATTAAVYVDPALHVVGGLLLDLPLAARMGAAANTQPPSVALDAIEHGSLTGPLRAGALRVLADAAPLFGTRADGTARARLHAVQHAGDPPSPALALALERRHRRDLVVDVAGLGAGRLCVTFG